MDLCTRAECSSRLGPRKHRESSHTNSCSFCRTLEQLNAKIAQQRTLHQNLLIRRDNLLSRFNPTHPTTIDRLPVEVASIIFSFYVSTFPTEETPFTLGAVCRKWRQIVWSTPEIWSYFLIVIYKPLMSETRVQLASEWLRRAGARPLSIRVHALSLENSTPELPKFFPLIDVINQYCDRWHCMYLQLPSSLLIRFDFSNVSSLNKVDLYSLDEEKQPIHALIQVLPRVLETRRLRMEPLSLNWIHVTHFTSDNLPVEKILQVLRLSPSLRYCDFGDVIYPEADPSDEAFRHVTHPILESLHISMDFDDFEGVFFNNVTLPALKHLHIQSSDYDSLHHDQLATFLTRSSSGLKSLELDEEAFAPGGLVSITQATPLLEKLRITYSSSIRIYQDPFYQALSSHLPTQGHPIPALTEPLLKSLRVFEWSGENPFPWEFIPMFLVSLSQYSEESRRPLEKIKIRCGRNKGDPIPYINEDIVLQLLPFTPLVQFQFQAPITRSNGRSETENVWQISLKRIFKKGE